MEWNCLRFIRFGVAAYPFSPASWSHRPSVRNKYAVRISCHASCGDLFTLSLCFNLTKTTKSAACLDTRHGGESGGESRDRGKRREK